jgi:hypothetical protein
VAKKSASSKTLAEKGDVRPKAIVKKAARPRTALATTAPTRHDEGEAVEDKEPKIAPPLKVLRRLVMEAAASRIRHRALLDVIEAGPFTKDRYFEAYKAIYDRDHDALTALLFLESADFHAEFGAWREDDIHRYGIPDRVDVLRKRRPQKKATSGKSSS